MNPLFITVCGEPKGQPRPRAFAFHGRARVYDPGTAEGWKSQIAVAVKHSWDGVTIAGPIRLAMQFQFTRPKSHFGTGKNSAKLKPTHLTTWHTGKPDADNLAKAVMDALTTLGVYRDDASVARLEVSKVWVPTEAQGMILTVDQL
jgi:Holliday junction resolvase RusA-like endonuclease